MGDENCETWRPLLLTSLSDTSEAVAINDLTEGGTTRQPCTCNNTTGRNLVVCIDGTSNQFGQKNTNVIELYSLIKKDGGDREQLTWYNSGIGTYARPSWRSLKYLIQVLNNMIDLAIAWNFESIVISAYGWLSENYQPGDRIYLIGFSRGAYQVRVLSAMIEKVGLIRKGNETQIPFAYELYADPKSGDAAAPLKASGLSPKRTIETKLGWFWSLFTTNRGTDSAVNGTSVTNTVSTSPSDGKSRKNMAQYFKDTFSRHVNVHFVGVWDTVSSVGIVRSKSLPGTTDGMEHVCYFRHALALDERRVKFLPEYVRGAKSHNNLGTDGHTKEVWFAGTHSDIGGGNVDNSTLDRSRPPLRWMVFEAKAAGLLFSPFNLDTVDLNNDEKTEVHESLKGIWNVLEWLPVKRLSFDSNKDGSHCTRRPHCGAPRRIQKGQKLHTSLLLNKDDNYTPKASFDDNHTWQEVLKPSLTQSMANSLFEIDQIDSLQNLVAEFIKEHNLERRRELFDILKNVASNAKAEVKPVIATVISQRIGKLVKTSGAMLQDIANFVMPIWNATPEKHLPAERFPYTDIHSLISSFPAKDREIARDVLLAFSNRCVLELSGHEAKVWSAVFSPDGSRILSGSHDATIRVWDALTGEMIARPFEGHNGPIYSVAFSPDAKRLVSGAADKTIRIWDASTGETVIKPFEGHTREIDSVSFSPDGSYIISGADDGTVRVWDASTGETVVGPLEGHTGWVRSVAFSPDGRRAVSGSYDWTLRIWDVLTGEMVKELSGHTDNVKSVAFSPDGTRIVSSSSDSTVRIWDALTGEMVVGPLVGHSGEVRSVAFSPDGSRVVSGAKDSTIRVWNALTGKMVGKPLRGHTGDITTVAFSPDGKRVVSGAWDSRIRIWDVEDMKILYKP